jgi:hypothetical protein
MKATLAGAVVGQVLSAPENGQVMIFVKNFYRDPSVLVDANGNVSLQRAGTTTFEVTSNASAVLIDQKGSGDLLQVQSDAVDRLLVKNNGEININATTSTDTDNLVVLKSNDEEVFTINARGQLSFTGNIFIKDDTFAGSIATDDTGSAKIMFTYDLGTGKPDVQLTVESDTPAFAQVGEWEKDSAGNYTGFNIKTFNTTGGPASVVVHYLVVGKQTDYQTSGAVIEVVSTPTPTPDPTPTPPADTTPTDPTPTDTTTPPTDTTPTDTTTTTDTTPTDTTTTPDTTPTDTTTPPTDTTTTTTDTTTPTDTTTTTDTSSTTTTTATDTTTSSSPDTTPVVTP